MKTILATISVLVCVGCASAPPAKAPHWDRPGGTAEAFRSERVQCLGKSAAAPVDEASRLLVFNGCMEEKGWRRE